MRKEFLTTQKLLDHQILFSNDQKKNYRPAKNSRPTKKFLDRWKIFSTGLEIHDRQESFSTDEKYSRPVKKFSTDKKFSTGEKVLDWPKNFSTHENKSRKITSNSERVDLHLAWWNDIWACYPRNWILKIISTTFVHYGFPYCTIHPNFSIRISSSATRRPASSTIRSSLYRDPAQSLSLIYECNNNKKNWNTEVFFKIGRRVVYRCIQYKKNNNVSYIKNYVTHQMIIESA